MIKYILIFAFILFAILFFSNSCVAENTSLEELISPDEISVLNLDAPPVSTVVEYTIYFYELHKTEMQPAPQFPFDFTVFHIVGKSAIRCKNSFGTNGIMFQNKIIFIFSSDRSEIDAGALSYLICSMFGMTDEQAGHVVGHVMQVLINREIMT